MDKKLKKIFKSAAAGAVIGGAAGWILPIVTIPAGAVIGGVVGIVKANKDDKPGM